jgi:hypothetical protein
MTLRYAAAAAIASTLLLNSVSPRSVRAQGKAATAKSLRCEFSLSTVATWNGAGTAEAALKPSKLVLRFDSINADEGTAELKNGTVGTGITVQLAAQNLHFIQSFRSGPLYVTTVFGLETAGGKLKAVHSRHEYFKTPLEGSTSSPEQYYGECEILDPR